jgi:hypothetical protein
MKILVITQHYPPEIGAASNRMKNITYFLNKLGHEVVVLTNEPSYPRKDIYNGNIYDRELKDLKNIEIYRAKTVINSYSGNKIKRLILYLSFLLSAIIKLLSVKKRFDLIIVTSPPIFVGVLAIIAKLKHKCTLYLDIRDLWPDSVEALGIFKNKAVLNLAYKFEKYLYQNSDKIIINSMAFKDILLDKGLNEGKIIYLPNGMTEKEIAKVREKNLDIRTVKVVYAGNLGYAQGLETLIEAAKLLKKRQEVLFQIIGDGVEKQKLMGLVQKYDLHNVEFLGILSKYEVIEKLLESDIGIIHLKDNKLFETVIPSKIFDYMAAKLPIVAGVKGEIARLIKESDCGFVCAPNDSKRMAENIVKLMSDKMLREQKGKNGYKYLKKYFIWDKNMDKFNQLIIKDIKEGM